MSSLQILSARVSASKSARDALLAKMNRRLKPDRAVRKSRGDNNHSPFALVDVTTNAVLTPIADTKSLVRLAAELNVL